MSFFDFGPIDFAPTDQLFEDLFIEFGFEFEPIGGGISLTALESVQAGFFRVGLTADPTTGEPILGGVNQIIALIVEGLRVLAGIRPSLDQRILGDRQPGEPVLTREEAITATVGRAAGGTDFGVAVTPAELEALRDQVRAEAQAAEEARVAALPPETAPPPSLAQRPSPFVPSLPGQKPRGYNPNDPFLPGSGADPGGPIDPRYAFPTGQELRELLEALGIEVPDPRDPAIVKKVVLYWLGQAFQVIQRRRIEKLLSKAGERMAVLRQLQLQRLLLFFQSLQPTSQHFNQATLERVARQVTPSRIPKRGRELVPLPVVICNDHDLEEDLCPSVSP